MGKTIRDRKIQKFPDAFSGMSSAGRLYEATRHALTTSHSNLSVGSRIYPAALSKDRRFIKNLDSVVSHAVKTKHCVAKNREGRRCGVDITPKCALEALQATNFFSSDSETLKSQLLWIAKLSTCKRSYGGRPHSDQAARIAQKWLYKAWEMGREDEAAWIAEIKKAMHQQSRMLTGVGKEVRFEEVEEDDEGVD